MTTKKETKTDKSRNAHTLMGRIDLPTIFCDKVFVSTREKESKNSFYIMSWAQKTMAEDAQFIEQSRTMVTEEHFKKIIDAFCNVADYYPEKKEEPEIIE